MRTSRKNVKTLLFLLFLLVFGTAFTETKLYNALTDLEPGPGEGYATIYVSPDTVSLISPPYNVGDKFTIEVRVHNYSQVAGWQVKLVWDANLINITDLSHDVDYALPGDFIFPADQFVSVLFSTGSFNGTHWYVMGTAAAYGAVEYAGEDAGLMRINFTITSVPPKGETHSCPLWLEPVDTYTIDENIEENDEELIDGHYEIMLVATVYATPSKIIFNSPPAKEGDIFDVAVRIANFSNVAKLQIKLWFNNTLLNCTHVSTASDFIFPLNESLRYLECKNDEGYILMRASTVGFIEYSGEDAGLVKISFAIIKVPSENQTLTCLLQFDNVDTWIKNGEDEKILLGSLNGEYVISNISSTPPSASGYPEILIFIIVAVIVLVFIGFILLLRRRKRFTR